MINICIIFYLLNIFASQINAAPAPAENSYGAIINHFSNKCPDLSNNVMINGTTKYMSTCKDVQLINPPETINFNNLNKFYCIGVLVADMQLCNSLSNYDYKFLPKSFEEFQSHINLLQKIKPTEVCKMFKKLELYTNTSIIPALTKSVTILKEKLIGPQCQIICSDLQTEDNTNLLCSLIYYVHSHIANVSYAQQTSSLIAPKTAKNPSPSVGSSALPNNNPTQHEFPSGISNVVEPIKKNKKVVKPQVLNHDQVQLKDQIVRADVINDKITQNTPTAQPSAEEISTENPKTPELEPNVAKVNKQTTGTTLSPSVGEKVTDLQHQQVQQHQQEQQQQPAEIPPKADQPPIDKGEEPTTKIKNIGDVTNPSPKQNEIKINKNIGPVLSEDKDYPSTSTEINTKNLNPANPDGDDVYNDDDDVDDDSFKFNNDEGAVAINGEEKFINSRTDLNQNLKTVDVEESNFFSYFMFISVMFIAGYVVYHNKQKIMALLVEGRRDRNSRRRPSTSSYRKLNSNLEEAVTSKCSGSASHVIY